MWITERHPPNYLLLEHVHLPHWQLKTLCTIESMGIYIGYAHIFGASLFWHFYIYAHWVVSFISLENVCGCL